MDSRSKSSSMEDHNARKKSKIIWTKGLSKKFIEAIGKLGVDNASPKKIHEIMNVDGLTRDNVASHLQKYRISLKKITSRNNGVHPASKPYLLKNSMISATSLKNPSLMLNGEQMKWPSYSGMHTTNPQLVDDSSSCYHFHEAANFNAAVSSAFIHSAYEEEILEALGNEDEFFLAKSASQDTLRNISRLAYHDNKKSNDAKSYEEENDRNLSSKSESMKAYCGRTTSKIIWTKGLKKKFLEAIGKLGIDYASPKKIHELMKVDGLTRDHVASYLQKYRNLLNKIANTSSGVKAASKPFLLESSMVNHTSFKRSSVMVNQDQTNHISYSGMHTTNPPVADASSSCFPLPKVADFNASVNLNDTKKWNDDMENVTAEDNLVLAKTNIASMFSYTDYNGDK